MDYFQGVVAEFLRANRKTFINTECLIQLVEGDSPVKGRHWYCDILAVDFEAPQVLLCEVTFSKSLDALVNRLNAWATHWTAIGPALIRDCGVPEHWPVHPRVFIPGGYVPTFRTKIGTFGHLMDGPGQMPAPKVTALENVLPWKYKSWNRREDSFEADE